MSPQVTARELAFLTALLKAIDADPRYTAHGTTTNTLIHYGYLPGGLVDHQSTATSARRKGLVELIKPPGTAVPAYKLTAAGMQVIADQQAAKEPVVITETPDDPRRAAVYQMLLITETPDDPRRAAVYQMLLDRYRGAVPPTEEMVDAVLDGLAEDAEPDYRPVPSAAGVTDAQVEAAVAAWHKARGEDELEASALLPSALAAAAFAQTRRHMRAALEAAAKVVTP